MAKTEPTEQKGKALPGRPLIILGMHRSGTSFLASHLNRRGLELGDDLLEAREGNQRGHYESMAVMRTHFDLIDEVQPSHRENFGEFSCFLPTPPEIDFTDEHHAKAAEVVASLATDGPWGWKDPRTCIFADLWLDALPQARVLAVYRHPLEIHDSLLRRGGEPEMVLGFDEARSIFVYRYYTEGLIAAIERDKDRPCVTINAPAAFGDLAAMDEIIDKELDLELPEPGDVSAFSAGEFGALAITEKLHALFSRFFPGAAAAFDYLQTIAAIPQAFVGSEHPEAKKIDAACDAVTLLVDTLEKPPLPQMALRFVMTAATAAREEGFNASQERTQTAARNRFNHLLEARRWALREEANGKKMEEWAKQEAKTATEMREWAERERDEAENLRKWAEQEAAEAERLRASQLPDGLSIERVQELEQELGQATGDRDWSRREVERLRRKIELIAKEKELAEYRAARLESDTLPTMDAVSKLRVERNRLEDEYYRTRNELVDIKDTAVYRILKRMGKVD